MPPKAFLASAAAPVSADDHQDHGNLRSRPDSATAPILSVTDDARPRGAAAVCRIGVSSATSFAVADPGGDHPAAARRASDRARPGPDRHRQDRGVRAAGHAVRLELKRHAPQALVLVPTRELAIQVPRPSRSTRPACTASTCCRSTAARATCRSSMRCKRGAQVVVGTPGRIIDHLERGTLKLDGIRMLVLDEADEMLQHGLRRRDRGDPRRSARRARSRCSRRPCRRRSGASPSATCASRSRPSAPDRHGGQHPPALLDGERPAQARRADPHPRGRAEFDAMLVFARTKQSTVELAERSQARGFAAAALNGDMQQASASAPSSPAQGRPARHPGRDRRRRARPRRRAHQPRRQFRHAVRHRVLRAPHRPHRPCRAQGEAILFVTPRERNMLRLHRARDAPADRADATCRPSRTSTAAVLAKFKARIGEALAAGEFHRKAVQEVALETGADLLTIAAAIASLVEGNAPIDSAWRQDEPAARGHDGSAAPESRRREAAAGPQSRWGESAPRERGFDDAPRRGDDDTRRRGDDDTRRRRDADDTPLPEVAEGGFAFEDDGRPGDLAPRRRPSARRPARQHRRRDRQRSAPARHADQWCGHPRRLHAGTTAREPSARPYSRASPR
jgi:hypothetical protein